MSAGRSARRRIERARSGSIPTDRMPADLKGAFDAAVSALETAPRFVCPHAGRNGKPALACGQHPRLGVMCPSCYTSHVARHDHETELRCDVCRVVADAICGLTLPLTGALPVRSPKGRSGMLAGTILLGGFGLCVSCRDESAAA